MSKFPERLRELRQARKLSQLDLANTLGYSCSSISNYETGKHEAGYDTLITLALFFDVSVDYLLGNSDNHNKNE